MLGECLVWHSDVFRVLKTAKHCVVSPATALLAPHLQHQQYGEDQPHFVEPVIGTLHQLVKGHSVQVIHHTCCSAAAVAAAATAALKCEAGCIFNKDDDMEASDAPAWRCVRSHAVGSVTPKLLCLLKRPPEQQLVLSSGARQPWTLLVLACHRCFAAMPY
jgi:hypothetical protein